METHTAVMGNHAAVIRANTSVIPQHFVKRAKMSQVRAKWPGPAQNAVQDSGPFKMTQNGPGRHATV